MLYSDAIESADMPMTNPDREWVKSQIQDAIRALTPAGGLRRAARLAKEYGSVVAYFGLVIALLGIAFTQHSAATKRLSDEATFEQKALDRLDGIDKRLDKLSAQSVSFGLKEQIASPATSESAKVVKALAQSAQNLTEKPDTGLLLMTGLHFFNSLSVPGAWDATLALAGLRSTTNSPQALV